MLCSGLGSSGVKLAIVFCQDLSAHLSMVWLKFLDLYFRMWGEPMKLQD